jgi:hypothetical protein
MKRNNPRKPESEARETNENNTQRTMKDNIIPNRYHKIGKAKEAAGNTKACLIWTECEVPFQRKSPLG